MASQWDECRAAAAAAAEQRKPCCLLMKPWIPFDEMTAVASMCLNVV